MGNAEGKDRKATMGKLLIILAALYFVATYYSVRRSSEPAEPCNIDGTKQQCVRPLVTSKDRLSLELWLLEELPPPSDDYDGDQSQQQQKRRRQIGHRYQWAKVESCQNGLVFYASKAKTTFDTSNGNCTLQLPEFSRRRCDALTCKDSRQHLNPLKAKFALRFADDNSTLVAEAPFDLTRIVERKDGSGGSMWGHNADKTKVMNIPHYKYSREAIVVRFVNDEQVYGRPPFRGDGTPLKPHKGGLYKPIVYVDDTSLRHSSEIEMAESGEGRPPLNVRIRVSVISPMRDVVNVQLRAGMEIAESFLHESELDEIRYLISDDHLYRFVLTQIISFLHIWLDYMAFRDEVGFYVGRSDMGGLSVSSILSRFACSLIIFLYLLDGGGTSWLVLTSVGSGVAADLFKVWKVLKPGFVPRFPFVTVRDPSRLSFTEKETSCYDSIARTYLSLLLYPLIAGSALYALKFYEYSSWWSWLISNLANAVYTFGFISLCPQLYVNYRLKSVAHMPIRVFLYKIFNTFVDDVFAFLIEMPLKHKLMTLRDDVVFLGFLVQAYLYRVDKTRANEFGFAYEQEAEGAGGSGGFIKGDKNEDQGSDVAIDEDVDAARENKVKQQ
jgi:hypothetical protein